MAKISSDTVPLCFRQDENIKQTCSTNVDTFLCDFDKTRKLKRHVHQS